MRNVAWLVVIGLAFIAACDNGPAPSFVREIRGMSITGPSTLAPGEAGRFVATARMSDQSTENYTDKVSWQSSNPAVLSITNGGFASGVAPGETRVNAVVDRLTFSASVIVAAPGTFRLAGFVGEAGLAVADANVVVTAGEGVGLSTTTDASGQYRLFGVAGPIEVQVSKAGYTSLIKAITVSNHSQSLDFPDFSQVGTVSMGGDYTLTVTAATDCFPMGTAIPNVIPAADATRSYSALVEQTGASLKVTLGGATFDGGHNRFFGRLTPSRLTFDLFGDNYAIAELSIMEVLASGELLSFGGFVETTPSASGVVAALNGWMSKLDSKGSAIAECRSNHHQFRLLRR